MKSISKGWHREGCRGLAGWHTHRSWIEGVAKLLLEKRTLTGADVPQLVRPQGKERT
jgi:hypothetical protein